LQRRYQYSVVHLLTTVLPENESGNECGVLSLQAGNENPREGLLFPSFVRPATNEGGERKGSILYVSDSSQLGARERRLYTRRVQQEMARGRMEASMSAVAAHMIHCSCRERRQCPLPPGLMRGGAKGKRGQEKGRGKKRTNPFP
jgi:hypothetical protein